MNMRILIVSLSIVFSFASYANQEIDLNKAYQDEFIFLRNQLEALKKRKAGLETREVKRVQVIESAVKNLKAQVSRAFSQNEVLKEEIANFSQDLQKREQIMDRVAAINAQMGETLGTVDEDLQPIDKIKIHADHALAKLITQRGVAEKNGTFFKPNGEEVTGKILKVGGVAAYAKDGGKWGLLDRLEGGTGFKMLDSVSLSKTPDFSESKGTVPVSFFSKNGQKGFVKKEGFLAQKIRAGGLIGIVILALGLFAFVIALIRFKLLSDHRVKAPRQLQDAIKLVQGGDSAEAKDALKMQKNDMWFQFLDLIISNRDKSEEVYESVVAERIAKIQKTVARFGPVLLVIAGVAPLLGLLGTVTGMIGTFQMITEHGTGNPKMLSGGIKEALVTTQLGLVVAIPCILAGNWLGQWSNRIISDFEEIASSIPKVN